MGPQRHDRFGLDVLENFLEFHNPTSSVGCASPNLSSLVDMQYAQFMLGQQDSGKRMYCKLG